MCSNIIDFQKKIDECAAYFTHQGDQLFFMVEARLCKCAIQWWVRTQNGYWTEARLDKPEIK